MEVYAYYLRTIENNSYLVISTNFYETVVDFLKNELLNEYEYYSIQGYTDDEIPYEEFIWSSATVTS